MENSVISTLRSEKRGLFSAASVSLIMDCICTHTEPTALTTQSHRIAAAAAAAAASDRNHEGRKAELKSTRQR